MNRREAKKRACYHAALCLESALASGWETLNRYGEDDRDRIEDALNEIAAELERRSL